MPHPRGQAGAIGQEGICQLDSDNPKRMGKPNLASADAPGCPPGGAEGTALDSNAAGKAPSMPV